MRSLLASAYACPLLLLCASGVQYASAQISSFGSDFSSDFENVLIAEIKSPIAVDFSPLGDLMFVTQKEGVLWVVEDYQEGAGDNGKTPKPRKVLDLVDIMCSNGERAFGGLALHPQFPTKPWIYVYYTYNKFDDCDESFNVDTGPVNRMARYTWDTASGTIEEGSEKVFFDTPRVVSKVHNSGDIAFGKDGHLYVTVGDGGGRTTTNDDGVYFPQALDRLLGKVIRLTDEGEVPSDNPFTPESGHADSARCSETGLSGDATTKCQEIYSYGHRNPFRFAMNPNTLDSETSFYVNEVGRYTWEEISEGGDRFKGANYGYPKRTGPCPEEQETKCKPPDADLGYTDPVHWYHHDEEKGGCVTAGAFIPNDIGWPTALGEAYLYADYMMDEVNVIYPGGEGCGYPECDPPVSAFEPTRKVFADAEKVIMMKFGPYGDTKALYYVTRGGTRGVYRVQHTGSTNRAPIADIVATPMFGFAPLVVNFDGSGTVDPDGDEIVYEWDVNDDGETDATSPTTWREYTEPGIYEATLIVRDGLGGRDKTTVTIQVDNTPPIPTIVSPAEGTTFAVGDRITLEGTVTDEQDGDAESSLTWEVREVHNGHYHPFLDEQKMEGTSFEIVAPQPEDFEASTNTYLEIILTATDSAGLTMTTSRILKPKTVLLEVDSNPSGLEVVVNGDTFVTPATLVTWENHEFDVDVTADDQTLKKNGESYSWASWSDGGDQRHGYVASSSNSGYILANFQMTTTSSSSPPQESDDGGGEDESAGADETPVDDTSPGADETPVEDTSGADEAPVSVLVGATSVLELLDFYVSADFEPITSGRRLGEKNASPSPPGDRSSRNDYLETTLIDQLKAYMRKNFDDTLEKSGSPHATLRRMKLTKKSDWTASDNGSTYQALYGGFVVFLKEEEDQHVPSKFAVQSMQTKALKDAKRLLPAMEEYDGSVGNGSDRIISFSTDVVPDGSVEQAATTTTTTDGSFNTVTIVAIVVGSCLAFIAAAILVGFFVSSRRKKNSSALVAETDESLALGNDKDKRSYSNTDSDESPTHTPEKRDPTNGDGTLTSGMYDQISQSLQVNGGSEKTDPALYHL